ncbi:MAG: GHKL domain-containing protein [Cytophagales bacterium]|nr:GHKL domain-containing protein [Cytophagales bacterium]
MKFEKEISDTCLGVKVPNLILQPIVENAIKYGVYDSIDQVIIRMTCVPTEEFLNISISNNFDNESVPTKGEGIGLENVKKRLNLVFGRSDLLEVDQSENEFNVVIKIPLNNPKSE